MKTDLISRRSFLLGLAACSAAGVLTACKGTDAPSGSTARHPIPTYDAVQVQCIQKVSICSNPPRSPFRASSDFLFVKTFRPTHTRLRSRMFLPLSAANHTAGRRSCL